MHKITVLFQVMSCEAYSLKLLTPQFEVLRVIKAAIVNILTITVDQMSMCNAKDVACSDKPEDNYHQLSVSSHSKQPFSAVKNKAHCMFPALNGTQTELLTKAAEHGGALISERDRYFSLELMESNTKLKAGRKLHLLSSCGHKHDFK